MPPDALDVTTVKIGGVLVLSAHMIIMAQFKRVFDHGFLRRLKFVYDFFNYMIAAILMLVVVPPIPIYSGDAWKIYIGATIALAVTATSTANKVRDDLKQETYEQQSTIQQQQTQLEQPPPATNEPAPTPTEPEPKKAAFGATVRTESIGQ